MICPFCNEEMKKGLITGDGRQKVRWVSDDESIGVLEKAFTEKGTIDAKYTMTTFSIDSYFCKHCKKMIFDTDVKK